jgi:hypothetical protein
MRQNLGSNAEPLDENIQVPYVLYAISASEAPIPIQDRSGGRVPYVQLLDYTYGQTTTTGGIHRYAVMLPIN